MLVRQPKTAVFFCENCQNHPDAKELSMTFILALSRSEKGKAVVPCANQLFHCNFSCKQHLVDHQRENFLISHIKAKQ